MIVEITTPRDPRALNGYRHGLTGQIVLMTPADMAAYENHCAGILQSLAPEGAMELGIAQAIADDRWRLFRAAAIDNSRFALCPTPANAPHNDHPELDVAFQQAVSWASDAKNLVLLSLYETRIQRRLERNIALLKQFQAERQAALQQAVDEADLLAQLAEAEGRTFDFDRDLSAATLPSQFAFSGPQIQRLVAHKHLLKRAANRQGTRQTRAAA